MDGWLKQSTAANVLIGPFIDDTDGKTAEAAVAITDSNTFLSKNGAAQAVKHETTHPAHDALGYYICALDTTDTDSLGRLKLVVHIAGALPVFHTWQVLPANAFDSLVAGSDLLDVSTVQWTGTAVAAPATAGYPVVTNKVGTGTGELDLTSGVIKANLVQILAAALTETGGYLAAAFKKFFNVATPTGTVNSIPDAVAGAASGIAIVGSAMAVTGVATAAELAKVPKSDSNVTFNATALASINAQADTAISDAALATAANLAAVKAETALIVADTGELQTEWANGGRLDLILDAATAPSAATVADAVWDEALAGHATGGTTGKKLTDLANADLTALATAVNLATVDGIVDSILADTGELQTDWVNGGRLDLLLDGATAPSAASVADAVWDEALGGHLGAGSTGSKLNAAGGAGGAGAISFAYTVYQANGITPLDGVEVWVTTDFAGTNVIAGTLSTSALGVVTFLLDAGTYYFWRRKSGWTFTNPDTEAVS